MKALQEIGLKKAFKFVIFTFIEFFLGLLFIPQLRVIFLRLLGATIGKETIIHRINFMNLYRGSFKNLKIGDYCFIGRDVLLDLTGQITLGNHVTLSERSMLLTHMNIGFKDHPLKLAYPSSVASVIIDEGTFIGVGAIILAGIRIGARVVVGAGTVVNRSIKDGVLAAGVPAKEIRKI
jgi:maltose O-acetyltransferase